MSAADEAERRRLADEADRRAWSRRPDPPATGPLTVVGVTVNGTPNDVQVVSIQGGPTSGSFTLAGRSIPFNATAAQVQTQLVAVYGSGNVVVSGVAGGPWTVTFGGTLLHQLVATMAAGVGTLAGGTPPLSVRVLHVQRGEPDYPTAPNAVYRFRHAIVGGTEATGAAGVVSSVNGPYDYAYNLGSAVPPVGTNLRFTRVLSRWIFRY